MCEAQLCGVKVIMVCRMSLHQVPWMESEPVKKSTNRRGKGDFRGHAGCIDWQGEFGSAKAHQ